jgi:ubiquinone biosynthesis protein UbiJ
MEERLEYDLLNRQRLSQESLPWVPPHKRNSMYTEQIDHDLRSYVARLEKRVQELEEWKEKTFGRKDGIRYHG